MRKKLLPLLLLLANACATQAQEVHRWWVTFADKAGTPYTIDTPSEYLGPRALERRTRLGVGIDSLDLPVNPSYTEALRLTGGTVWTVSKWLNGAVIYTTDSNNVETSLRALPFVAGVQYYGQGSPARPESQGDTYGMETVAQPCDSLYGPDYYGLGYDNIMTLNGIALHRAGYDGEGLLVGVCDGGFPGVDTLEAFAPLRDEGRLVATRDFVHGGNHVFDIHNHGTRVLSSMASRRPGFYVGTAPKASYILCRTEDAIYESPLEEIFWAAAMEYLDSMGVDVVNTSLGYNEFDNPDWNHSATDFDGNTTLMARAANIATARGILVVVAAGNNGYRPGPNIGTPADSPSALVVGALDHDGLRAVFSSFGPTADGRVKPDVMSLGARVWVVNPDGTVEEVYGTSLASPILAGMAVCLVQRYPDLGPTAWCDSIRAWSSLAYNPENETGYGTPNFSLALRGTPATGFVTAKGGTLRLVPNPATNSVEIATEGNAPASRMELFDVAGRCLMRLDNPAAHIDISHLGRGVYTLRLVSPSGTATAKLVKQ